MLTISPGKSLIKYTSEPKLKIFKHNQTILTLVISVFKPVP